ncbi:hypothetical protein BT69DRAFT_1290713 [Atractiella rhizophila]|nr:hypothetical protein BT69DRAFT_1290713 [Atractiella rhizophila]
MSYEPHYIYETLMYDSLLHWPIYNPSYTEADPVALPPRNGSPPISTPETGTSGTPSSTTVRPFSTQERNQSDPSNSIDSRDPSISVEDSGVASPAVQPSFGSRLASSLFGRWLPGTPPSPAPPPRTSGRSQGRGGEWRIGDFGYCANGTFRYSRNADDFLGPEDAPLSYSLDGVAWGYQTPLQRGEFESVRDVRVGIDTTPTVSIDPFPTLALQYYNRSQHAAVLATKSNPLRFAVTHQLLAVQYFKQYYKTVLEDDLSAGFSFGQNKNLCMIIGVVKSHDWLHAVFHQSGSSFRLNMGVQAAGFQLNRDYDYGDISRPSVRTGPTNHQPRNGIFSAHNNVDVGDQTLFISRIMFKGRLMPRLLVAGGFKPPSPSQGHPDKKIDEIRCDQSSEQPATDPLDVLLEAMLMLRPDVGAAIASDNDVDSLCQKALWTFKYAEWTTQKAMELLQTCVACIEEEDKVLTLNFPIKSPNREELLEEDSEQQKVLSDSAVHNLKSVHQSGRPELRPKIPYNVPGYTNHNNHNRGWHQHGSGIPAEERLRQLSELIGYPFDRQNYHLWITAITNASYIGRPEGSNGGLARLGDLAMKTVQTAVLHRVGLGDDGKRHNETIQSRLSQFPLELICRKYRLQELVYHRLSGFPGRHCADLVRAIIGAVYLDCVAHGCNPMEMVEMVMNNLDLLCDPSPPLQEQAASYYQPSSHLSYCDDYQPSSSRGY